MKFVISSTALLDHLQVVSRVINVKNTLPILDNFLFDISDNKLTITASDIDTTMITNMELTNVESEGMIAIPARLLLETLKEFPEQPLVFEIDTETYTIVINTENGKYTIMGQNPEEYPRIPSISNNKKSVTAEASIFVNGISKTIFAAAEDDMRPMMNGINVDIKPDSITFVASDAHKLLRYTRTDVKEADEGAFILSKKPATILKSILSKTDGHLLVEYDEKNASFTFPSYKMICRLIEGVYPNYNSVIPTNNPNKMIIDRVELLNSLKRVSVFANQASNLVKLNLANNQVLISAQDLDFSISAYERLNCQYDGDEMEIGFKSSFLIDILNNLSCVNVVLELSDPSRAGLIIPVDKDIETEDMLSLLMPMMIG